MEKHLLDDGQNEPRSPRQRAVWAMIFGIVGVSIVASLIMAVRMMSL